MATTERDYYELLGVARDRRDRDQEGVPRAGARAPPGRLRERRTRSRASSEMAEAYEVLSNSETRQLYDRYGHAGLRSRRVHARELRLRQPRRPLLRVLRRRPLRRRRPARRGARRRRRGRGRDRARRGGRGDDRTSRFAVAVACATCDGERGGAGDEPGRPARPARRRPGAAGLEHAFSAVHPRPPAAAAAAPAGSSRRRADVRRRGPHDRGADARGRHPAGIHDGQRIRLGGRGSCRRARRPRGRLVRPRPRPARPALRPRGARHLISTVDLTMTQAALGTTVTVPTIDGESSSSSSRARSRTRSGCFGARACPSSRARPRRPPPARHRRRAAAPLRGAARPARAVRAQRGRRDLQQGRGLLRQAEERVPLSLRRVSVDRRRRGGRVRRAR